MKAADDPKEMTDTELLRAVRHHRNLGQSYQRIADLHWKASNAAENELARRQREAESETCSTT